MGIKVKSTGQSSVFGRRKEPHTVIIAHGDNLRHFTIRPWLAALFGSALAAVAVGYLLATSYLVLRDDLIGASVARQARMQQAYEDRIAALRAQVDRITSRQLLDQQLVESKVGELLQRQSELTARHETLGPLLGETSALPATAPVPGEKPGDRADIDPIITGPVPGKKGVVPGDAPGRTFAAAGAAAGSPFAFLSGGKNAAADKQSEADRADMMFIAINRSLRDIEADQMTRLDALADNAYQRAEAIGDALQAAGVTVDADLDRTAVGGPLIPVDSSTLFDTKVKELDVAVSKLDEVKNVARRIPIANPGKGWPVSSTFGVRSDPFLGTAALHSGMDFRAPPGTPIRATAAGVVTRAGWAGGYGRLVEIEHANGFSTRFGHMSKILVSEGDTVKIGDIVGEVGSSGRSTGPHLHYEVRKNGKALDPIRFIRAGKAVSAYLASH